MMAGGMVLPLPQTQSNEDDPCSIPLLPCHRCLYLLTFLKRHDPALLGYNPHEEPLFIHVEDGSWTNAVNLTVLLQLFELVKIIFMPCGKPGSPWTTRMQPGDGVDHVAHNPRSGKQLPECRPADLRNQHCFLSRLQDG